MDMLTATHAWFGHALLIDCRSLRVRPIAMPRPQPVAVLVADTGVRHDLAEGGYAERRQRCEDAARDLGLGSLRDADLGLLAGSPLQGPVRHAARHVICENERTLLAAGALATGGLETLGELMFDSHASLRDLLEVSCPELDAVIETAASLGGVIGARLTGAGFGGCAVILCRADAAARITAELKQRYAERFGNLMEKGIGAGGRTYSRFNLSGFGFRRCGWI